MQPTDYVVFYKTGFGLEYAAFFTLDLSLIWCILQSGCKLYKQTGFELVMLYSA